MLDVRLEFRTNYGWESILIDDEAEALDLLDFCGVDYADIEANADIGVECPMTGDDIAQYPSVRVMIGDAWSLYFSEEAEEAIAEEYNLY